MKKIRTLILILALIIMILPLSACNTMEGLGKDTRAAGESLENAARGNKGY
jgi:predicted small secreted protein